VRQKGKVSKEWTGRIISNKREGERGTVKSTPDSRNPLGGQLEVWKGRGVLRTVMVKKFWTQQRELQNTSHSEKLTKEMDEAVTPDTLTKGLPNIDNTGGKKKETFKNTHLPPNALIFFMGK